MSRYRKIDTRIWNDEKVRTLSDDGKLAFLYVLTHPAMTSVGAMRGTLSGLAAELGWKSPRLVKALQPAIDAGMIEVNETASYVGLPRFLRYNQPESPNVVRAWVGAMAMVPECPEKILVLDRCRLCAEGMSKGFQEAFTKGFGEALPKSMPIPEPRTGAVSPHSPPRGSDRKLPPIGGLCEQADRQAGLAAGACRVAVGLDAFTCPRRAHCRAPEHQAG